MSKQSNQLKILIILSVFICLIPGKQILKNNRLTDLSCQDSQGGNFACQWIGRFGRPVYPYQLTDGSRLQGGSKLSKYYIPQPCFSQRISSLQKGTYKFTMSVFGEVNKYNPLNNIKISVLGGQDGPSFQILYPLNKIQAGVATSIQGSFVSDKSYQRVSIGICKYPYSDGQISNLFMSDISLNLQEVPVSLASNCMTQIVLNSKPVCIACLPGYVIDNRSGICMKHVIFCSSYTNGLCSSCVDKFGLVQPQNVCVRLPQNCIRAESSGQCLECRNGYQLTRNTCNILPANCSKATSSGQCTACIQGFELKSNKCIPTCGSLQFLNAKNICQFGSIQNCLKFQNITGNCSQCSPGYNLYAKVLCCPVDTLTQTSVVINGKCVQRDKNCMSFSSNDNRTCVTCKFEFIPQGGRCLTGQQLGGLVRFRSQSQNCQSVFKENDLCDWKRWILYPVFPLSSISSTGLINGQFLTRIPDSLPFISIGLPMAQQVAWIEKGCYTFSLDFFIDQDTASIQDRKIQVFLQKGNDYFQLLVQKMFDDVNLKSINKIQQQFYLSQDFQDILILIVLTPAQRQPITFVTNISITKPNLSDEQLKKEESTCKINSKVQQFNQDQLSNPDEEKVSKDIKGDLYIQLQDQSRMYISGPWANLQVWKDQLGQLYIDVANGGRKYLTGNKQGSIAYLDASNNWYFIDDNGKKSYLIDQINSLSIEGGN